MQRMPQYNQDRRQRPIIVRPRKPQRKKHFRWEIIILPAVILLFIWFISNIEPAGTWDDLLDHFEIRNKLRFSALFTLGVLACGICAFARVLRDDKKKGN